MFPSPSLVLAFSFLYLLLVKHVSGYEFLRQWPTQLILFYDKKYSLVDRLVFKFVRDLERADGFISALSS